MNTISHNHSLFALLSGALLAACVDSSIPDDDSGITPPTGPQSIDVQPPTWTTVPGKVMTFQAIDPISNAPLMWSAPGQLNEFAVESHSITLGSAQKKGMFTLVVSSSADPDVVGEAKIQVVPFGFSGSLGSLPGNAANQPLADVAVTRGPVAPADRRVFLALYDHSTGTNAVTVWDHSFATKLDEVPGRNFNYAQRPRIAADSQGCAYWVEQYFDSSVGDRARALLRYNADGTFDSFVWTPAVAGGLQLVPGTDIACDDDGVLYFLARNGLANVIVRFANAFTPGAAPEVVGALAATGPQVRLAVDSEQRLLVSVDSLLSRWSAAPRGGVEIEVLADLGAAPGDLEVDADGTLYVMFDTHVDILDMQGNLVGKVKSAEVGLGAKVPFENLLGLGVDGDGNLRLADDPLVDDPQLGASSLRTYALDVQEP